MTAYCTLHRVCEGAAKQGYVHRCQGLQDVCRDEAVGSLDQELGSLGSDDGSESDDAAARNGSAAQPGGAAEVVEPDAIVLSTSERQQGGLSLGDVCLAMQRR